MRTRVVSAALLVTAAIAVPASAVPINATFEAGTFNVTPGGGNVISVPASGQPGTVVSFGINFTGALATSLANQNLAGAVAKTQFGPMTMGGFNGGPFQTRIFSPPLNTQYAATAATPTGFGYNPSTALEFALSDELNPTPDAWGDPIVIKYAVFRANGSFAYRHAWRGTFDAGTSAYTFETVFWASGPPNSTAGQFAGSSWTGNWGDPANPDLNWDYVYTGDGGELNLAGINAASYVVPGSGLAAIGTLGLAGMARRRRR